MDLIAAEAGEMIGEGWQRDQSGPLRRIAEDAQEGILRERTCGPGLSLMIGKPVVRGFVMNVVLVEERDEDVDVEQRGAIHISSRSRLTSAIVMIGAPGRLGSSGTPFRTRARDGDDGNSAFRASSDSIWPAVFFCRTPSSFTA